MLKYLTKQEADAYLNKIGMKIGGWNNVEEISGAGSDKWVNHQAPRDASLLYHYSQVVANWLPRGEWKILQIDNSGGLRLDQAHLFCRLLFGSWEVVDFTRLADPQTSCSNLSAMRKRTARKNFCWQTSFPFF